MTPRHLDPRKTAAAVGERGTAELADAAGLHPWLCEQVVDGLRRASGSLRRALAAVVGDDVDCDGACPACATPHRYTGDELGELTAAASRLLVALADRADAVRRRAIGVDAATFSAAALGLADLAECGEVAATAARLGAQVTPDDIDAAGVGRLVGVALDAGADETVAADLAAWLSGQEVARYTFVGLDARRLPAEPVDLGEWTLLRPGEAELADFSPVPRAHAYHRDGWDTARASAMWWLRRHDGWVAPSGPLDLWPGRRHPGEAAEPALAALALAGDGAPLTAAVRVEAEHRGPARVTAGAWPDAPGPPDDLTLELGWYVGEDAEWVAAATTAHQLVATAAARLPAPHASRLRRGLWHLLRADELRAAGADRDPDTAVEVAFELAVCLEALVVDPGAATGGSVTSRLAVGCAWLAGDTDTRRRAAKKYASALYHAASAYRHADARELVVTASPRPWEPDADPADPDSSQADRLDLDTARRFTGQVVLAALAVAGRGTAPHERLAAIAVTEQARQDTAADLADLAARPGRLRRWPLPEAS